MNRSEELARQYLESAGFTDIVFEPDGNVPPDFLLDGRIAVEVRRLNQNEEEDGKKKGLEESAYPLFGRMESLLKSMGPPVRGSTWFVLHAFHRPIPDWSELKPRIIECCMDVAERSDLSPGAQVGVRLHPNFELSFVKASKAHDTAFLAGGFSDFDSGGLVLAQMEVNIQTCIDEKTQKIKKVRQKYKEWWLVLIDYIGYGLSPDDVDHFKNTNTVEHEWDKVVVVSPLEPTKYFEL